MQSKEPQQKETDPEYMAHVQCLEVVLPKLSSAWLSHPAEPKIAE